MILDKVVGYPTPLFLLGVCFKMTNFASMLSIKKIVSLSLIVLSLFSCKKDFDQPDWDVEMLTPLLKTTLNLNNILPDSILQTEPDTSLKLVYQTNLFDIDMDSIVKISDTTITEVHTITFSSIANPGSSFISESEERTLNIRNGVELHYVSIESGFVEIEIVSEIKERLIVTYSIPSATKNGDTLALNDYISAATDNENGYLFKRIDLSGYELNLTGVSGTKVNTFITIAEGTVDTLATEPVAINGGTTVSYGLKFINVKPYFARGYFGDQQIHIGPSTTKTNAFSRITAGTLDLEAIDFNLEIKNGIGVDLQMTLNQLATSNTTSLESNSLSHSSIGTPLDLNRAQLTGGIPEVTYFSYPLAINTSNSNIDQLIEILPNELTVDLDLFINPMGNTSGGNDFFYKKHSIKTDLNVEFPLSLIANNLTLEETIDFNFSEEGRNQDLNEGKLFLYANNGFPFNANIQLLLYDANNKLIQNLPIENYIEAAPVNAALRVTNKKESIITVPLSSTEILNLYATKQVVLKIAFTTTAQPQFVKIYEEYELDIKMVGDFSYNINFK
jgi:hypothetical protein